MDWTKFARLAWFDPADTVTDAALAGRHGGIVTIGNSDNMNENAPIQLDALYKRGMACFGYYGWNFDYTYGMSMNAATWPTDTDPLIKLLDQAIFIGGSTTKRKYSALIIDISNTVQVPHDTLPDRVIHLADSWVWEFAIQHLTDMLWKRYRLPVYLYFTHSAYKRYIGTALTERFKGLTQDNALSSVRWVETAGGYPVEAAHPRKLDDGGLLLDSGYWWLWLYDRAEWDWLYNGTPAKLYGDLGLSLPDFGAPPVVVEPEPEPDDDTPPTADLTPLMQRMDEVITTIGDMEQAMTGLTANMQRLMDDMDDMIARYRGNWADRREDD